MTRELTTKRSGQLDKTDYELIFTSLGDTEADAEWSTNRVSDLEFASASSPVFSWALSRVESQHVERTVHFSALANALSAVVTQFAFQSYLRPYEDRIRLLEEKVALLETKSGDVLEGASLERGFRLVQETESRLGAILDAFQTNFDGVRPHATLSPHFESGWVGVKIVLDASDGDAVALRAAREDGARLRLLEQLAERLPDDVFSSMDLNLVFER